MWHGRFGRFGFRFGFPPFGFWFHGMRSFPRCQEFLGMLEELKEVEKEIEELNKA